MGVRLVFFNKPFVNNGQNQKLFEDHNDLINRDISDQHPMYAITGLNEVLSAVEALLTQQTSEHEYLTAKLHEAETDIEMLTRLLDAVKTRTDELLLWKQSDVKPEKLSVVDNDAINLEYDEATRHLEAIVKVVTNNTLYSIRNRSHTVNRLYVTKNGLYVPNDVLLDSDSISWETEQSTVTHAMLVENGYYFSHKSTSGEDVYDADRAQFWRYDEINDTILYDNPNENSGGIWQGFISRTLYTDFTIKMKFKYAIPWWGWNVSKTPAEWRNWYPAGADRYLPLNNADRRLASNGTSTYDANTINQRDTSNIGITLYVPKDNGNFDTFDIFLTRDCYYSSYSCLHQCVVVKNFKTNKFVNINPTGNLGTYEASNQNIVWDSYVMNEQMIIGGLTTNATYWSNRNANQDNLEVEETITVSNGKITFIRFNIDDYWFDNPNRTLNSSFDFGRGYFGAKVNIDLGGPCLIGFATCGVLKATITKFEVTIPEGSVVQEEQGIVTVDNFRPHVNISKAAGNDIQTYKDGLYVHGGISSQANNAVTRDQTGAYFVQDTQLSDKFGNGIEWDGNKVLYCRPGKDYKAVNQIAHGFSVGNFIFYSDNDNKYSKALAIDNYDINVVGMVTRVIDADNFEYMWSGYFATDLFDTAHGYTQGMPLYLSNIAPGVAIQSQPDISKTVGYPVENNGIIISLERGIQYNNEAKIGDIKQSTNTYNVRTDGFIRIAENVQYKLSLVNKLLNGVTPQFKEYFVNVDEIRQILTFTNVDELRASMAVPEGLELFIKAF